MKDMNEHIEQLARQKNFAGLSAAEQEMVLAVMPRDEFEALHEILLLAPTLDTGTGPAPYLKTALLGHLAAGRKPASGLLQKQVPLWLMAATTLLAAFLAFLLKKEPVPSIPAPVTATKTDTLYQDRIVWRDRFIVRKKIIYREKTAVEPLAKASQSNENQFFTNQWPNSSDTPDLSQPPLGSSLADEPELLDFLLKSNK